VAGYSEGQVHADSSVLSVIPHTLIDNALKYSRAGSKVTAAFRETFSTITFSVTSFGPKIDQDETDKIFDIFYRGRHAQDQEDGTGFGLHLAQFVAHELHTKILVSQSESPNRFGYQTSFSVSFERVR
jgi:K+-sensing histidine kinase KdpD